MAVRFEKPSYIFRAAGEFSPDAEVMAKKDVENYVRWLNQENKADIEELNEEHGKDIELTWRRAARHYEKEIESLKARIKELGENT